MTPDVRPPVERRLPLETGADPALSLVPLWQGPGDPVMRVSARVIERAMRLPGGAAALRLEIGRNDVMVRAWGPGADEAVDLVPGLIGERDDPTALAPRHPLLVRLKRDLPGLRLTRGAPLSDTLLFSILGQKVTSLEARRSYRALVRQHGEPAPGPLRLTLPPTPEKLARLPYWAFHPLGIERRRADTIRAAATAAPRLATLDRAVPEVRLRTLTSLPGIGPWTAAESVRLTYGDPDAVSVGDFHIPRLVCHALAGEPDGGDERMLELLEPYRGQRARVVLLLERGGMYAPRRAPRMTPRSISTI